MSLTPSAALLSAAASAQILAQGPMPEVLAPDQGLMGEARADSPLYSTHATPAGTHSRSLPAGTLFHALPVGPKCREWPERGAGSAYSFARADHGFSFGHVGKDLVEVFSDEQGTIGPHQNRIHVRAPTCVPCLVDIHITSLVDARAYQATAEVEVVGYQTVTHAFVAGRQSRGVAEHHVGGPLAHLRLGATRLARNPNASGVNSRRTPSDLGGRSANAVLLGAVKGKLAPRFALRSAPSAPLDRACGARPRSLMPSREGGLAIRHELDGRGVGT